MRHVYGPVPSRRLGRSLGIDPVPPKTCNWNCVYCQLGRTTREAALLQLAASVLGTGKNSRLYQELIYNNSLVVDLNVWNQRHELASIFNIDATLQPDASLEEVNAIIERELDNFLKNGPTEDELQRVQTRIIARRGSVKNGYKPLGYSFLHVIEDDDPITRGEPLLVRGRQCLGLLTQRIDDRLGQHRDAVAEADQADQAIGTPDGTVALLGPLHTHEQVAGEQRFDGALPAPATMARASATRSARLPFAASTATTAVRVSTAPLRLIVMANPKKSQLSVAWGKNCGTESPQLSVISGGRLTGSNTGGISSAKVIWKPKKACCPILSTARYTTCTCSPEDTKSPMS